MAGAIVAGAVVSAAAAAYAAKKRKQAEEKAIKAQQQRDKESIAYSEKQAAGPVKMQNWNPIEYAQKSEAIQQDNLRRAALGSMMAGGMGHFGGGTVSTSDRGTKRYNMAGGSLADALKASGYFDALKAQTDRKIDPKAMLDMDSRYVTEGIKPGEAPPWAVGLTRPPAPDPAAVAAAAQAAQPNVAWGSKNVNPTMREKWASGGMRMQDPMADYYSNMDKFRG